MIPQLWIIECFKILKISKQVVSFTKKAQENRKVELVTERQSLAEIKIQRSILQRDLLLSLLIVIAMILLNYILRIYNGSYGFQTMQEKT